MSLSSSPIPFAGKEVEIKGHKEVDLSEVSNVNKEKLRLVLNRMASTHWVETDSCVSRKPELSAAMSPGR